MNKNFFSFIFAFILMFTPFIISTILFSNSIPAEAAGEIVPSCNTGPIDANTGQYVTPCNFTYFMTLINNVIKFLLFTIATPLIALIVMYTGYLYLTAGGDTGKTEKVRHILFNAVIGYVVALAAWLIVRTILSSLNVDSGIETFLK